MQEITDPSSVYRRVLQRKRQLEKATLWRYMFSSLHPTENSFCKPRFRITDDKAPSEERSASNAVPYKRNRVNVNAKGNLFKGYINASYVKFKKIGRQYIMAAIPPSSEKEFFWRMILEQKVPAIVMFHENTEGEEYEYYPSQFGGSEKFGPINVECVRLSATKSCFQRKLIVKNDRESHEVVHYHFHSKIDYTAPNAVNEFFYLYRELTSSMYEYFRPPPESRGRLLKWFHRRNGLPASSCTEAIVIQCLSGSGESGTFVIFDILSEMLRTKVPNSFSIESNIVELRAQRMNSVETVQQYRFIYEAFLEQTWRRNDDKDLRNCTVFVQQYADALPVLKMNTIDRHIFLKPNPTFMTALEQKRDMIIETRLKRQERMMTEERFYWKNYAKSVCVSPVPHGKPMASKESPEPKSVSEK